MTLIQAHAMSAKKRTKEAQSTPFESDPRILGFPLDDDRQAVKWIHDGISFAALVRFQKFSRLPMESIAQVLRTAPRTLARRTAQGRLTLTQSERLFRLARVYEKALMLFEGDRQGAAEWLCASKLGLGGETPMRCIETEPGAREVENLIGRLEHGVFT